MTAPVSLVTEPCRDALFGEGCWKMVFLWFRTAKPLVPGLLALTVRLEEGHEAVNLVLQNGFPGRLYWLHHYGGFPSHLRPFPPQQD